MRRPGDWQHKFVVVLDHSSLVAAPEGQLVVKTRAQMILEGLQEVIPLAQGRPATPQRMRMARTREWTRCWM